MSILRKVIVNTFSNTFESKKDERISFLVEHVKHGLQTERSSYSISKALENVEYKQSDLPIVKGRVFYSMMKKIWEDHEVTEDEGKTVLWVAKSLEIMPHEAAELNLKFAQNSFALVLADAMADGKLDDNEVAKLNNIAKTTGCSLPEFSKKFFKNEGESFLRSIFLAYIEDDRLTRAEWEKLLLTSKYFGLSKEELQSAISEQTIFFIENVLINAKADESISSSEKSTLLWLISELGVEKSFFKYVKNEIEIMERIEEINKGHLPVLRIDDGFQLKAGEVTHFKAAAIWEQTKFLSSGPKTETTDGILLITDNRIVFSSDVKSHSIAYSKIILHKGNSKKIEAQVEGKTLQTYRLKTNSEFAYPILNMAIGLASQTKAVKLEAKPTRHISREVRQKVWIKYGGKCVDCHAREYLEYDHIIPVAKGGSNLEMNIQILCRRCNLKKSDKI